MTVHVHSYEVFVGGCMLFAATTHYADEIHQMTEGALFLRQQLNATVSVGWHIGKQALFQYRWVPKFWTH